MKNLFLLLCSFSMLFMVSCEKEAIPAQNSQSNNNPIQTRDHGTAYAYVSSNTSGTIGIYPVGAAIANPASVGTDQRFITVPYADADGVVYDENRDALYQVNRTNSMLVAYAGISSVVDGDAITPSAMGPSTFTNGREATIYNNKVVVADDVTPGVLVSYHVNDDHISNFRMHNVGIELWGIQTTSKDLYAIEDASSNVVYYKNYFKAKTGTLNYTAKVSIEGLVRTHGIHYDEAADIMVLTDIGSAASADDGALIIITDYTSKMNAAGDGGMIPMADQVRIGGPMSTLGNPVDVDFNVEQGSIFVAERANGGGKFLVFEMQTMSGDYAPVYSTNFAGASAVTTEF